MYKRQCADKTLTLRKSMYMRASGASEHRKCWHFAISFNILLVLQKLCRLQMTYLSAYMYRQISKCTDKTLKKTLLGAVAPLPPSDYASEREARQARASPPPKIWSTICFFKSHFVSECFYNKRLKRAWEIIKNPEELHRDSQSGPGPLP